MCLCVKSDSDKIMTCEIKTHGEEKALKNGLVMLVKYFNLTVSGYTGARISCRYK